jgi:pimeloyl-ACP methyl ester carboxylesterase
MQARRSAVVVALAVLVLSCSGTPMLYPAPGISVPSPPPAPLEEVGLEVEGVGVVSAWHRPGGTAGPALVFFHGNGENLETLRRSGTLEAFAELGLPFLAVDYPGYGNSEGKPHERGLVAAGVAAVRWMEAREPQRPIAVVGWSLGAAVGLQVATRIGVERVVAMSPWTSLADIGREHFPGWLVGAFLRESYDSIGVAPRIDVPALVVHGELDTIIPVAQGRRVAAALPRSQLIEIEGYGHNDLLGSPRVWQELRRFLGD